MAGELTRAVKKLVNKIKSEDTHFGYIGTPDGITTVPGRPSFVYVTRQVNEQTTTEDALEDRFGVRDAGYPVRIEFDAKDNAFYVAGAGRFWEVQQWNGTRPITRAGYHTHVIGGDYPEPVEGRRFLPGLTRSWQTDAQKAGDLPVTTINAEAFPYYDTAGDRQTWTPTDTNAVDWTSSVPPTSGGYNQQRWVQPALNPDPTSPAIVLFNGTPEFTTLPLSATGYNAIAVTDGYLPLDAFILKTGDELVGTLTADRWAYARITGGSGGGASGWSMGHDTEIPPGKDFSIVGTVTTNGYTLTIYGDLFILG